MTGSSLKTPGVKKDPDAKNNSSGYAAKADNELGDDGSISNWLLDRHAFLLTRVPLGDPEDKDEPSTKEHVKSINEHINFYNAMTAWSWPSQWTSLGTLPHVDSRVKHVRANLWDAYNRLPAKSELEDIVSSHVGIITSGFSALLHAVDGASTRDQVPTVYSPNEAELRRDWDMLLMKFYQMEHTPKEEGLADILLERLLNYSRNPLADVTDEWEQAHKTLGTMLTAYDRLCRRAVRRLSKGDPLRVLAEASIAQVRVFDKNFKKRSTSRLKQTYEGHIADEAKEGKCDAVLLSPCEGGLSSLISELGSTHDNRKTFLSKFLFLCGAEPKNKPTRPMLPIKTTEKDSPAVPKVNVEPAPTAEAQGPPVIRSSARLQEKRQDEFTNDQKKMLQDVFHGIDIGEKKRTGDEQKQNLLLPVLVAEYKKLDPSTVFTSMNQCRMYLVSALQFLNALGFKDRPVFGLVTNGTFGAVTMGWQIDGVYFVLERGVEKYNIADPFQALQFSLFLVRLAEYAKGLDKLKENKEILDKKLQSYTSIVHWSRRAQLSGYRLAKDEIAPAHEERDV